jgi:hypothetical protein
MQSHPRHKFFLKWIFLLPFIIYFQVVLGRAVFSGIDILKQHVPMKYYNAICFKAGYFPLWNPITFKGFPHFAEGQSGPLYPGNILLYVLPIEFFIHAYDCTVILHVLLGVMLCYIFFRRKNLSPLACFFASVTITFGPFMMIHTSAPSLHQVMVMFPLLLMIYDASLKRPFLNMVLGGMLVGVMLFAGHVQMVVYSFISLGIYAIFIGTLDDPQKRYWFKFCRSALFILFIAVVGAGIAAIQLIPTSELAALSERGGTMSFWFYSLGTWLNIPRIASIMVTPSLGRNSELLDYGSSIIYFGVLPILFFAICWRDLEFRRKALPWLICFGIVYLLAMGTNNPLNLLLVKIPPLNYFRYLGRHSYFASFFLAFPLALAVQTIMQRASELKREGGLWKNVWRDTAVILCFVFFMTLFTKLSKYYFLGLAHFTIELVISLAFIAWAIRRKSTEPLKYAIFVYFIMFFIQSFMVANLTQIYTGPQQRSLNVYRDIANYGYMNKSTFIASSRLFIVSSDFDNFLLTPQDQITYDASGSAGLYHWGIPNINGYTPLRDYRREEIGSFIIGAFLKNPSENDLPFLEYLLYDILGVNFLIVIGNEWNFSRYHLPSEGVQNPIINGFDENTYLYVANQQHPGFYLRVNDSSAPAELSKTTSVVQTYMDMFQASINIESLTSPGSMKSRHIGMVKTSDGYYQSSMFMPSKPAFPEFDIFWNGITEKFEIRDPEDMYDGILLHESFYPGWEAYVNGKRVEIQRGDGLFKFIPLGKGENYSVELKYYPKTFQTGFKITLVTLSIWFVLFILALLTGRKKVGVKT